MAPRTAQPPAKRRRRRKVARTEDFSSDSDSSSSSSDSSSDNENSDSSDNEIETVSTKSQTKTQSKPKSQKHTEKDDAGLSTNGKEGAMTVAGGDILDGEDVKMSLEIVDTNPASLNWTNTKFDSDNDDDEDNQGDNSDDDKTLQKNNTQNPKSKLDKATNGQPSTLDPDSKGNKQEFTEYYLSLMTGGAFGDDLNKIRESNDFGDGKASMPLLIAALKEGVNMFDKEQRELIWSAKE